MSRALAWSKDIRTRPPPSSAGLSWWYSNPDRSRWATWARTWAARSTVACRPVGPSSDTPRLRGCSNWETYPASCDRPRSLLCSNWRNICQVNQWLIREKRVCPYACDDNSLNLLDFSCILKISWLVRVLEIPCVIIAWRVTAIGLIYHWLLLCCSVYLPLRSNDPVIPSQLREVHVEPLLATLAFYCTAAFDRSSSHALHSRRIRTHD